MIKSNGGVFGRNPTFNNVTVDGAATVGTNLTLTNGDVIVASGRGISFAATTDPTIAAVAARGAFDRTATNVANNDTVTIGTTVYTFKATLTPADYEVHIGADAAASLTNLRNAINGTGGTPGTDYQVPAAHARVTAGTISGTMMPLEAITPGVPSPSIALNTTSAQLARSGTTMTGGLNAGSVISEVLSDYEVGNCTLGYQSATGSFGVIAYSNRTAEYVKIGNLVTINGLINTQALEIGTASGNVRITGLPYAISAPATWVGGVVQTTQYWGTQAPLYVWGQNGQTFLQLTFRSVAGGDVQTIQASNMSVGTSLRNSVSFTISYRTT